MLPRVLAAQPRAQHAPEHEHPDEQAGGEQHLPDPGQVEVLEALQPEPVRRGALEHAVDAEERADQGAEDDDRQRAEQRERELALMPRLAPGDHRREEDPGGHERRRDPEQRELHVPGAHQVVREDLREVEAEEARELGAVVLRGGADERLDQEQRGHHEEEPRARALRRRQRDVAGRAERQRGLLAPVPAEPPAPAAEGREQQPDPAEQRDQREHAPDDDVRRRRVVDARLRRPVVGVGVVVPGPLGRRPPRPSSRRTRSAARARCDR